MRTPSLPAALFLLCAATAQAQEAAAVLARGSGPYFETYISFQKSMGRPISPFDLEENAAPRLPAGLRVAAAFGSRAAALKYPKGTRVVYALAPGFHSDDKNCRFTRISPLPEPGKALTVYKRLQPGLRRLAVFHLKCERDCYIEALAAAAEAAGMEILPVPLSSPEEFPGTLRTLLGRIDAFWLLPEPALIDRTSLMVLAKFSCSNKIPFYAPAAGLLPVGAAASFAPGFAATGAAAAEAVRRALDGEDLPDNIFPAKPELFLNREIIDRCGLPLKGASE